MELLLPRLFFFDPEREGTRERKLKYVVTDETQQERRLFCAACKRLVTHQNQRITVQGDHEHRCTNPLGITYRVGCFRDAPGCTPIGEATAEHTWFRGYSWRIALCANCQVHLGWHFQSAEDCFHGLIVDRLTSASPGNDTRP